jgi:hypothetical protein
MKDITDHNGVANVKNETENPPVKKISSEHNYEARYREPSFRDEADKESELLFPNFRQTLIFAIRQRNMTILGNSRNHKLFHIFHNIICIYVF